MTAHDPHLNVFYYYSGRRTAHTERDRQIEDNTTKALINALQLSARCGSPNDLLKPFLDWIGIGCEDPGTARFALQRETIGERAIRGARRKALLGIAPSIGQGGPGKGRPEDRGSRADAWIWGRDFVVAVETKVRGTFDPRQLAAHKEALGTRGVKWRPMTWKDLFTFLNRRLDELRAKEEKGLGTVLLDQLVEYLRILAYQEEIGMENFDGFAPDAFDSFSAAEDEEAEDTRKSALHAPGSFVLDLRDRLPKELRGFKYVKKGVIRARDRYVWATLSRLDRPVDEPHFSFVMTQEGFSVTLLLEGDKPTTAARRAIANDPDKFLALLRDLGDCELVLNRRWEERPRKFPSARACSIGLEAVGQEDVAYLLTKMAVLKRKGTECGFFEIRVQKEFSRDMKVLRSREFVATVVEEMKRLAVLDRFFSGRRNRENKRKKE